MHLIYISESPQLCYIDLSVTSCLLNTSNHYLQGLSKHRKTLYGQFFAIKTAIDDRIIVRIEIFVREDHQGASCVTPDDSDDQWML